MTAVLGLSAYYHDSAAALVRDGVTAAAAQEERFSRIKHDASFPARAVEYCLAEAGLNIDEVNYVAFYEKPFAKFDRLLETFLAYAPRGLGMFRDALPVWLKEKLHARREINRHLNRPRRSAVVFPEHHESHAASAFFPSPFQKAAILTVDGVGEWATTVMGVGEENHICLTDQIHYPHSLGLLYSAFTAHCGFRVNDGEYKLMGLAPYGTPAFRDTILNHLIELKGDGSYRLNMRHFRYPHGPTMTNRHFDKLFGGRPRRPGEAITQRHKDLAASVQVVIEEAVLRVAAELHRRTGLADLVMAGGVALNCVANARLLRDGPFERLWVQPAAGDAGGALGAALFARHQLLDSPRRPAATDSQQGSLLGPGFTQRDAEVALRRRSVTFSVSDDPHAAAAAELAAGRVVGWCRGRMEYGPRALGSRSILADARLPHMQSLVNQKIKFREDFRPFAPAVLADHASDWFDLPRGAASPYMLLTGVSRRPAEVPAVTHVDGTSRVQTVDARHADFRRLLTAFHGLTGCPLLLNTSLNVRDEPIVCTPDDAVRCFLGCGLDVLVLGDCVARKPAV